MCACVLVSVCARARGRLNAPQKPGVMPLEPVTFHLLWLNFPRGPKQTHQVTISPMSHNPLDSYCDSHSSSLSEAQVGAALLLPPFTWFYVVLRSAPVFPFSLRHRTRQHFLTVVVDMKKHPQAGFRSFVNMAQNSGNVFRARRFF